MVRATCMYERLNRAELSRAFLSEPSFPNAKYWKILVGARKAIHVMIICVTKAYVLSVWCVDYKTYRYEFGINTQKNTIDE